MAKVSVDKELLAEVLVTAESDSYSVQAEFSCSDEEDKTYQRDRERIRELRAQAGLEDEGNVVGQGFFGAAIAINEQSDNN